MELELTSNYKHTVHYKTLQMTFMYIFYISQRWIWDSLSILRTISIVSNCKFDTSLLHYNQEEIYKVDTVEIHSLWGKHYAYEGSKYLLWFAIPYNFCDLSICRYIKFTLGQNKYCKNVSPIQYHSCLLWHDGTSGDICPIS